MDLEAYCPSGTFISLSSTSCSLLAAEPEKETPAPQLLLYGFQYLFSKGAFPAGSPDSSPLAGQQSELALSYRQTRWLMGAVNCWGGGGGRRLRAARGQAVALLDPAPALSALRPAEAGELLQSDVQERCKAKIFLKSRIRGGGAWQTQCKPRG